MKIAAVVLMLSAVAANAQSKNVETAKARIAETPESAASVTRAALETLEQATDRKFLTTMKEDPFYLLGATRGVYLEGYGVVFSTEVDLAPSAAPNPFRPAYSAGEKSMLREKKQHRLTELKKSMREMLYAFASSLSIGAAETVALAVTVPYFSFENSQGMARQIIMTTTRQTALDAKGGSLTAVAAIKVQELF